MSKLAVGNLACALIAISLVIYVFTHPRCFTAAGADYAPYRLFVLWCLAELLAIIAIVLGLAGLWRSRGRSLFTWLLLATTCWS